MDGGRSGCEERLYRTRRRRHRHVTLENVARRSTLPVPSRMPLLPGPEWSASDYLCIHPHPPLHSPILLKPPGYPTSTLRGCYNMVMVVVVVRADRNFPVSAGPEVANEGEEPTPGHATVCHLMSHWGIRGVLASGGAG